MVSFQVGMVGSRPLEAVAVFLLEVVVNEAFHSFLQAILLRPSCVDPCRTLEEVHTMVVDRANPEAVVVDRCFVIHDVCHHC